jgi:hypothetical protein
VVMPICSEVTEFLSTSENKGIMNII